MKAIVLSRWQAQLDEDPDLLITCFTRPLWHRSVMSIAQMIQSLWAQSIYILAVAPTEATYTEVQPGLYVFQHVHGTVVLWEV